jgi:N-acetylgalactosamine kinase
MTARSNTKIATIILCAGKGRRMGAVRTPKVCFPVAGKAVIAHMLERLTELRCQPNIIVVGHLGGAVVDEVGPKFPQAVFTYQSNLLGTGHATRQGVAVLSHVGFDGAVLVIAGDKFVELRTLEKLIRVFESESPDLALVVAPKNRWPDAGRIVTDRSGRVLSIIERADLKSASTEGRTFEVDGRSLTADELESEVQWVNQAVYLYRAGALFEALDKLTRDNVQQEEYLTDTVDYLIKNAKSVIPVPVDDPEDVLGFNTPAELLEIEEHYRRTMGIEVREEAALDPRVFKAPQDWAARLANPDAEVEGLLRAIYGDNQAFCEEKRKHLLEAVELFINRYGADGTVAVIRAPGRVNLMGRHVDHRGGHVNLMAIDREHILVARRRADTTVRARNADATRFDDLEFSADDLLRRVRLDDWRDFVDSEAVVQLVRDLQGDWGNYLKAPMLRLQQQFKDRQIFGVDCVVSGDIPMAAGLSSSSALVVAMAEALVLTNQLDVAANDFVDLCGEGEWFVGTRGGSADHAAVKLSNVGQVVNVGFFPFSINEYAPFPKGYALVVCNSQVQARKAEGARDAFNERVASYEMAVHLVRKRFPNYAHLIGHLRDISPAGLGIRAADVYRILLDVPERVAASAVRAELGDELFDRLTRMHKPPEAYALRGRLLFGIAECARSKHFVRLLREGHMERAGWLMNVSHDGDRVVTAGSQPFAGPASNDYVRERIADLQSEDPDRVLAGQLYAQPGDYACSIPAIDTMVDIALTTPGVLGAQLAGAGLGGCMMVLAREDAVPGVIERLAERYYLPNGLEPSALPVRPIAGCCALTLAQ